MTSSEKRVPIEQARYSFDTSPLNYFTRVDQLELLETAFAGRSFVAPEVMIEIGDGVASHPELKPVIDAGWLTVQKLNDITDLEIIAYLEQRFGTSERAKHRGEIGAIAVAKKLNARAVLDDLVARNAAQSLGLKIIGTVGLLANFAADKKLTEKDAWEIHEDMCNLNPGGLRSPIKTFEQFRSLVPEVK